MSSEIITQNGFSQKLLSLKLYIQSIKTSTECKIYVSVTTQRLIINNELR